MRAIAHHLAVHRPPYSNIASPTFLPARRDVDRRDVFKAVRDHYAGTNKVRWESLTVGAQAEGRVDFVLPAGRDTTVRLLPPRHLSRCCLPCLPAGARRTPTCCRGPPPC